VTTGPLRCRHHKESIVVAILPNLFQLKVIPGGLSLSPEAIAGWEIPQVICTDVESDGTLRQPNYSTYEELRAQLPADITLIAAGGISRPEHVSRLKEMGVDGAVVGRALYEGDQEWEKLIHAG